MSFGYGNTVATFSMAAPYIDCIKQGQRSALRILSLEGMKVSEIYERIMFSMTIIVSSPGKFQIGVQFQSRAGYYRH